MEKNPAKSLELMLRISLTSPMPKIMKIGLSFKDDLEI